MTSDTEGPSREEQMIVIARDENGKPTIWCDPEIADLVTALNAGGVPTIASCSGHGHRPGSIALKDGRWLVVAKDDAEHDAIESIFLTDINGDPIKPRHPLSDEGLRSIAAKQFGIDDPNLAAELAAELLALRGPFLVKGLAPYAPPATTPTDQAELEVVAWLKAQATEAEASNMLGRAAMLDLAIASISQASAAIAARDARIVEMERELAEHRAAIASPEAVHANMLRGDIPRLSIRDALHLHGEEALAKWDRAEADEAELAKAKEVLAEAFDFLGGVDGAEDIRERLLPLLSEKGQ